MILRSSPSRVDSMIEPGSIMRAFRTVTLCMWKNGTAAWIAIIWRRPKDLYETLGGPGQVLFATTTPQFRHERNGMRAVGDRRIQQGICRPRRRQSQIAYALA